MEILRKNSTFLNWLVLPLLAILYYFFGYEIERSQFEIFVFIYVLLFAFTYYLIDFSAISDRNLTVIGFLIRLIFLFSFPNLSQDFYRFIWDGRMLAEGVNPYLYTPNQVLQGLVDVVPYQAEYLIEKMQSLSANNYSNYPPVCQAVYYLGAEVFPISIIKNVIFFRLVLILADLGTFYFIRKILKFLKKPPRLAFWYFINPFIVIELIGNLHFEGLMILFLSVSIYFLLKQRWELSAILLGLSVSVKLLPFLFLPLFFQFFRQRKELSMGRLLLFYGIIFIVIGLTFLPFLNESFYRNFSVTIALWFNKFEFNASVYYVLRYFGFLWKGYNMIGVIGKVLPVLIIGFIFYRSFFKQDNSINQLLKNMLFCLFFYLIFSSTVHPWYLAMLLFLGVLLNYRFTVIWTLMIILSYSAYQTEIYQENLWWVGLEYLVVFGYFFYELNSGRGKKNLV